MVEGFDIANTTGNLLSGSWGIVVFLIVVAVIGAFAYWYWLNKQYKYQVHLKVLKSGTFTTYYDTARQIDKDGERYWKLRNLKETVSIPPDKSITQTVRGGWVADGYYERNIGVIWATDSTTWQEFDKLSKSLQEKRRNDPNVKFDAIETQYQPITSQERSLQASQITKAVLRKGKSGWELLLQLLPAIMIFFVLVLVLIFWNKIAEPVIQTEQMNQQISTQNALIQQQNLRFYMMLTGGKGNGTYVVQKLPEDQQTFPELFRNNTGGQIQ